MSNFYELVKGERQMKSLTGLGREKFELLLESFSESLEELKLENYQTNRSLRSRRPGGGQKGGLPTAQDKLFFILYYLKTYPTFDSLGYTFRISSSKACENVTQILPVLSRAQANLKVQPLRRLTKVSDLESALESLNEPTDSVESNVRLEEEVYFADNVSILARKKARHSQIRRELGLKLKALYEPENAIKNTELAQKEASDAQASIPAAVKTSQVKSEFGFKLKALDEQEHAIEHPKGPKEESLDAQVLTQLPNQAKVDNANPTHTLLIDVTERTHFRHQNNRPQRKHYSGKKQTHTVKNTVMSTPNRRVVFLGQTFPGSVHDYNRLKQEVSPKKAWWAKIKAGVDLGYQGIKTDYENSENIYRPHKKPRKSKSNPKPSLTKAQKRENRKVSKKRIFIEHAIGGMKAFHILSTRFRNRRDNFADEAAF